MKITFTFHSFRTDTIFILNIPKKNNSEKQMVELWFLLSAYCKIKLYVCTKFYENIDYSYKVILVILKGHYSEKKNVAGVMVLI